MTKFKQGDRVVPERFEQLNHNNPCFNSDMERLVNIPGEITGINRYDQYEVHGWFWPSSALRPASPNWEPGQECRYQGNTYTIYGVCEPYAWIKMKNYNCPFSVMLKDIRPIAPSLEEELRKELHEALWKPCNRDADNLVGVAMPIILAWHKRHKEGEGR